MKLKEEPRIICISNRLPIALTAGEDPSGSDMEVNPSAGGLVTAMGPILSKSGGLWIGWPGDAQAESGVIIQKLKEYSESADFSVYPVMLDDKQVEGFYQGFSNQIIWPLFHDLQSRCNFEPSYWSLYLEVQELFKEQTISHLQSGDLIWVHDYHLMGLAESLRASGIKNKLAFFLHTPFPGPDIFSKLPWRSELISSLLSYDLVGFQTQRDLNNFHECVKFLNAGTIYERAKSYYIKTPERDTASGFFPISIDFEEFESLAASPKVVSRSREIKRKMDVEFLILSIDRLDYTKGIPDRLRAFYYLLERYPELRKRVALLQVVVPSRVEVPEYIELRSEIDQLVSEINGLHGEPGWMPVHHLFRSFPREEVIAMYLAADALLVTPLKDGMNLVAKEFCASRKDNSGALILSEFAGAADELGPDSYLVNPCNMEHVAEAIAAACLSGKKEENQSMQSMRSIIKKADVFSWAGSFLGAVNWTWTSQRNGPRPANIWDRLLISKVLDL